MSETLPSPGLSLPTASPVETKLRSVLESMSQAVGVILDTEEVDRFGRAARLCVMGQKISSELVTTIREAKKVRALDHQAAAAAGLMGPEGQYIAQGGGDIEGYAQEQQDYAILNPHQGDYGVGAYPLPVRAHGAVDQVQLQRDLMMMLQGWLQDQKKANAKPEREVASRELSDDLHTLFRARDSLQHPKDFALLQRVEKQITIYVSLLTKGKTDVPESPDTVHVVPAELLRGHPSGAGEQWGDAGHSGRAVLHREGGGEEPPGGGASLGNDEETMGD